MRRVPADASRLVAAGLLLAGAPQLGGGAAETQVRRELAGADVPLTVEARNWIRDHRRLIQETAARLEVPPLALAGIVAAERSLLRDPYDAVADRLFRTYVATLSEERLRRWVAERESQYQRGLRTGGAPGFRLLKDPYVWSLGPAQVSFRNALFYEPRLARLEGRRARSLREIVAAAFTPRGSLEYAAAILRDAQDAYAEHVGLDLRDRPGILATLYHLGSPARRALRLGEENRLRERRGLPPVLPRKNFYGEFVDRHLSELDQLLR